MIGYLAVRVAEVDTVGIKRSSQSTAGVARSRSEALAWCVRLVAEKQAEWLKDLKSALAGVEKARAKGPRI